MYKFVVICMTNKEIVFSEISSTEESIADFCSSSIKLNCNLIQFLTDPTYNSFVAE